MLSILRLFKGENRHYYRFVKRVFQTIPENIELYKLALVHRSASITLDDRTIINNERLEFLGDAIIEAVVSEMLFIDYPDMNEGALTQLRSRIVSRTTLNQLALDLKIDEEVIANPASINFHKHNIYGDAFEALVGALYLDKGYNCANRTLIHLLEQRLDITEMTMTERDFKSRIIEWCQKNRKSVEFKSQPASNFNEMSPTFDSILMIDGQPAGTGNGRSKKEAEQNAARKFYEEQNGEFENGEH